MRNRNHRVVVCLNDEEYFELQSKVKKSGLPREVFLRRIYRDGYVKEAPPTEYPKLLRALGQIGNNLNQIAATANTIHFINPKDLSEAISLLKYTMKQLHRSFQIPDQKRIQEEIAAYLQYIYMEAKKTLDGMGRDPTDREVLRFIQDAVAEKAAQENAASREYRDTHPTMLLGFLPELYTPFKEEES